MLFRSDPAPLSPSAAAKRAVESTPTTTKTADNRPETKGATTSEAPAATTEKPAPKAENREAPAKPEPTTQPPAATEKKQAVKSDKAGENQES